MDYAVVIGINDYEMKPLSAAVQDARDFSDFLVNSQLVEDKKDTLKLLLSSSDNNVADGNDIDKAIDDVIKNAKKYRNEKNRLYFYFSGHGIGVTFDNTALCLRYWPDWNNHCISSQDYKSWFINKSVFDEILIFLDCCREYDQLVAASPPKPDWKTQIGNKEPKILIFNSTMYGKLSYEVGSDQKRGAFTAFLLQSLNGDADLNNTGTITSADLIKHINNHFESYATQSGKYQKADVFFQGVDSEKIVLCKLKDKNLTYNCKIVFKRSTFITLRGGNTEVVKSQNVENEECWQLKLEKGFYIIDDNNTGEKKLIENYSENTITNVEF